MLGRFTVLAAVAVILAACNHTRPLAPTVGEELSGNTYVPLDGLPIKQSREHKTCAAASADHVGILEALPDISVRFAVRSLKGGAEGGFGPVATTVAGQNYEAILDYVNNDAVPVTFEIRRVVQEIDEASEGTTVTTGTALLTRTKPDQKTITFEARVVDDTQTDAIIERIKEQDFTEVTIPIYVGLGLRVTANVVALEGGVNISALGQISAESEKLAGNLSVQAIGVNGTLIGGAIPTPNKLDQTTIENAILAIGSSRTALYANIDDRSRVNLTPRVVGLYSPVGSDPRLINAIYSALAKNPPKWPRPCVST